MDEKIAKTERENRVPRQFGMTNVERILASIAALLTILTVFNSWVAYNQEKKLDSLMLDASFLALEFKIEKPADKQVIYTKVYNDLQGSFHGRIPFGRKLFVFIKDGLGYKLVNPELTILPFQQKWYQRNLNFGSEGVYDIVVCIANEEETKKMSVLRTSQVPRSFSILPSGMVVLASVELNYQKGDRL